MSKIKLSKSKKAGAADRVLLCNSSKDLKSSGLTADEIKYVQREESDGRSTVYINRYSENIFVQLMPKAKTDDLRNEYLRMSGNTIAGQFNMNKCSSVQIDVFGADGKAALCLAEGMALGNYKFNKYRRNAKTESNSE
ncbi:MAG: hypothetical protein R2850_10430 [Bacteroidia bacterium]